MDLERELDDANDLGTPESWRPRPGDRLVGTLVRYDQREAAYGPTWVAVVKIAATEKHGPYLAAVWLFHAVLIDEFKRLKPRPGETLGIKRLPDGETKAGKPFARYKVVLDRPDSAATVPDFDAMGEPKVFPEGDAPTRADDDPVPF